MAKFKRHYEKRDQKLPRPYDSWLEYDLHNGPLKEAQHHPKKEDLIPYIVPRTYEYDFLFTHDNIMYLAESKGRWVDSSDASRYQQIRSALKDWHVFKESGCEDIELFYIFENHKTAFPHAKRRKNGTKMTNGEYASKHGYRWLCKKRGDLEDVHSSESLVKRLEELN